MTFFAYEGREEAEEVTHSEKKFHLRALENIEERYYVITAFSLAQYPLSFYRERGFRYIVASSSIYDRYFAAEEIYPEAVRFYRKLDEEAIFLKKIPENPELHPGPGPEMKIYYLPPAKKPDNQKR